MEVQHEVITDLPAREDMPLDGWDETMEEAMTRVLRRIAPDDGSRVLLVAASFNSAI